MAVYSHYIAESSSQHHAMYYHFGCYLFSIKHPQALVLCQYLEAEFPAAVHGKRVVELGAGTGLAGMVALALGE